MRMETLASDPRILKQGAGLPINQSLIPTSTALQSHSYINGTTWFLKMLYQCHIDYKVWDIKVGYRDHIMKSKEDVQDAIKRKTGLRLD